MASGFLNSAGTDLDNLFYIDNSNAGAIGFVTSDGQDLGNRYTAAATLGTNVGFTNSAGTDIGYLRGNLATPTGTASGAVSSKTNSYWTSTDSDSEGSWTVYKIYTKAVYKTTVASSNGMPIASVKYTVQVKSGTVHTADMTFNLNSTTVPGNATAGSTDKADFAVTKSWKDVVSYTGSALTFNFGFLFAENSYTTSTSRYGWQIRIKVDISNAAGTSTIYTSSISL